MSRRAITITLALLAVGCQSRPKSDVAIEGGRQPAVTVAPDTSAEAAAPHTGPSPGVVEPARPTPTETTEVTPIRVPRRADVPIVTVRELMTSDAYVGKRVEVAGRCLGYAAQVAVGPPPVTRSDWQLEDADAAIFVTGPLPGGCSPTEGSAQRTTILALVAQDTLPALGNRAATARRYLVRIVR